MSDMANSFRNARVEMVGIIKSRICEWHVYKTWTNNMSNILGATEEKEVLDSLKEVQQIFDNLRRNLLDCSKSGRAIYILGRGANTLMAIIETSIVRANGPGAILPEVLHIICTWRTGTNSSRLKSGRAD